MALRTEPTGQATDPDAMTRTRKDMRRYWQLTRIVWAHANDDGARASRALALRSEILGRLGSGTDAVPPSALRVLASEAASLDARTLLSIGLRSTSDGIR